MGFIYLVKEHSGKGMMMQMLRDGILKLNHLLPNGLFKGKKTCMYWGQEKIANHLEVLLERECVVVGLC
jgi:hypothetical protein